MYVTNFNKCLKYCSLTMFADDASVFVQDMLFTNIINTRNKI